MIQIFHDAWKKGLEPEDYDPSRWDAPIQGLQGGTGDPATFDVSLTVSTMRYVSALRVGRINPKHLKFDLHVGRKDYDLACFVRDSLVAAPDLSSAGCHRKAQEIERRERPGTKTTLYPSSQNGGPGAIRTPDPFVRSEVLYPTELRARVCGVALGL
jgi:Scaffold domain